MKKSFRLMLPLLLLIMICGAVVARMNWKYNNEVKTAYLSDGVYSDGDVEIRLCARGQGTDEVATWDYSGISFDEQGNEVRTPYIGTIYELTVTNKTADLVNEWDFDITMPEDTFLNSGWNGEFEIHQNCDSGSPALYSTSSFDMKDSTVEYTNHQSCLLIPLGKGDWFRYTPSSKSDEVPVPPSDLKEDAFTSKTIGFILYFEDKDMDYIASFSDCVVRFRMYRSIWNDRTFRGVLAAFIFWFIGFAEMIILYLNTRKLMNQQKRNMKIISESMETFANFIDAKDPNTKGHSVRVAHYASMIAEKTGMNEEECRDIYYIGLLHDCGKISIPQDILMKPGRLSDEEYQVMKSHSLKGYEMLANFTSIPNIGEGAYSHHERYDGKGYPQGLSGKDIPLIGRIICVADAFDAMNSKRCYRDRLDREVIISELKKNRGIQFDPDIADIFLGLIESGEVSMD